MYIYIYTHSPFLQFHARSGNWHLIGLRRLRALQLLHLSLPSHPDGAALTEPRGASDRSTEPTATFAVRAGVARWRGGVVEDEFRGTSAVGTARVGEVGGSSAVFAILFVRHLAVDGAWMHNANYTWHILRWTSSKLDSTCYLTCINKVKQNPVHCAECLLRPKGICSQNIPLELAGLSCLYNQPKQLELFQPIPSPFRRSLVDSGLSQ